MSLIFCDKNKELCEQVKKLNIPDLIIENKDILKCKAKYPNFKICTASNPDFSAGGGLDKILKDKYPEEWAQSREFNLTENLFFIVSVDNNLKTNNQIITRALAGVLGYKHKNLILTGIGTSIGGFEISELLKILKNVLSYADLSSANLRSADLSSANLRSADLSSANLSFVNLSSADLRSANLRSADLSSANLRYADLSSADLRSANLRSADLSSANLSFVNLSSANLSFVNLSFVNLSSADLRSANLRSANLRSADLSSANLRSANLSYADLSSANLSCADLSSAKNLINKYKEFIKSFKFNKKGLIVYKGIGKTQYPLNKSWEIKEGAYLQENVNFNKTDNCGCGVNFGTIDFIKSKYPNSVIWECLIEFEDMCEIVVPYNTDGKARCGRLKLVKIIKEGKNDHN